MTSRGDRLLYQCGQTALVRAARFTPIELGWPDLADESPSAVARWRGWLQEVWAHEEVAEAITHASPALGRKVAVVCSAGPPSHRTGQVGQVREVRRTVVSVVGYLARMAGRATPFGLFAGVTAAEFGPGAVVAWGREHHAVVRADGRWISEVIGRLESCPELLQGLPVLVNSAAFVRGGRLIVPFPPRARPGDHPPRAQVSLRCTAAVRLVLAWARDPICFGALVDRLTAEFPQIAPAAVSSMVTSLVEHGALITALHAPSTTLDAVEHVLQAAEAAGADDASPAAQLLGQVRDIWASMVEHNNRAGNARDGAARDGAALRGAVREAMTAVSGAAAQPVAVDLRVDCALVLPSQVAHQAAAAASVLARLTPFPFGTPAWKDYHNRFFERYGVGALVPLREVVDPDVGLGWPAGYLGGEPEPDRPLNPRDVRLLELAQAAALDGCEEIVLDEALIDELAIAPAGQFQVPPHLELRFHLQASSPQALTRGDFGLTVLGPSRGIGTVSGRFIELLEPRHQAAAQMLEQLPGSDPEALPVQVCFAPLERGDAHVARVPELLPAVISLAEHRAPGPHVIDVDDLAVGCDRRRLYLASVSRGRRLDPITLHALDLRAHTPPLARFVTEIARAQAAAVVPFAWGAAAGLPFVPRVRWGRVILAPARWRLHHSTLPDPGAPMAQWLTALHRWRDTRRIPDAVCLTEGDRLLRLDLAHTAHAAVLRAHLATAPVAVLTEAPADDRWLGGHAHEIVVPLTAAQEPSWPKTAPVTATRLLDRDHAHMPGASRWLLASIYAHADRHAELIGQHLPALLACWDPPLEWWFTRYRDPRWHLRLRIALPASRNDASGALPEAKQIGAVAAQVGAWAARLRGQGLVGELRFGTSFPEYGRWGRGAAMAAAEQVFCADSRTVAVQFTQPRLPDSHALAAANMVSIAAAFTGSIRTGMDWLISHGRVSDPQPLNRGVLRQAVRLADPARDWAALRAAPGGEAVVNSWRARDQALARYRAHLTQRPEHPDSIDLDLDLVLDSLLHAHHIRVAALAKDHERRCVRLAHAAAHAWTARQGTVKR